MGEQAVGLEKFGKTALVTLNRPKKNALDRAIRNSLPAAIAAARDDASVRSVVLTGAGGDFRSGADLGADIDGGKKPSPAAKSCATFIAGSTRSSIWKGRS